MNQDLLTLHSGTVTFLFTDIQGSTELLKQLGEAYATLLADQRSIKIVSKQSILYNPLLVRGLERIITIARKTSKFKGFYPFYRF